MKRLLPPLTLAIAGALLAGTSPGPPTPQAARRVDVNRASEQELMTLPGVDRTVARRIIARRPFANRAKFLDALGLPPAQMQIVASQAVVGGAPEPLHPPAETKSAPPSSPEVSRTITPGNRTMNARPAKETAEFAPPAPLPYDRRVDINTGSLEEIERVARLDGRTAGVIIANRPYRSLSELSRAGFLHEKILELSHFLRVGPTK